MSKKNSALYVSIVLLLVALVASTAFIIPNNQSNNERLLCCDCSGTHRNMKDINTGELAAEP
jgi:hypothetical protein